MVHTTTEPEVSSGRSLRNSCEGLRTSRRPSFVHLKDADFIDRPKAIFHRSQDAKRMARLAFEIEHTIDHVLKHFRTSEGTHPS